MRAVPKEWKYRPFPDVKKASMKELVALLKSNSAVARLNAQQEMLTRPVKKAMKETWKMATDKGLPLYTRVAAIFTYAQAAGENGNANLLKLVDDGDVKEWALRALADRKVNLNGVPIEPFIKAINDPSPRVQVAAITALGRLGHKEAIPALLSVKVPASFVAPAKDTEGPHATPNSAIIPAHVAVRALISLNAVDECIAAIGTERATWLFGYALYARHQSGRRISCSVQKKTTTLRCRKKCRLCLACIKKYPPRRDYSGGVLVLMVTALTIDQWIGRVLRQ